MEMAKIGATPEGGVSRVAVSEEDRLGRDLLRSWATPLAEDFHFDEVGNMRVRDPHTIQIMKDYMANGRFSRGVEVIANASLAYVGNIDESIEQLVSSSEHDLFAPLPKSFGTGGLNLSIVL